MPLPPAKPKKTEKVRGLSMLLYGPTGTGKTSFAANFPRAGFLIDSQEQGIRYLTARKLCPDPVFIEEFPNHYRSWLEAITRIGQVVSDPIDTLVIESLTGFEAICFLYHAKRCFASQQFPDGDISNSDIGFYSYQKGPKSAAKFDFPPFLEALNVVLRAGKNVILTGHSMEKEAISPEGVKYQKNIPVAEKEIWARIARWASIVAFMGVRVEQDLDKSRGALKKVAKPELNRLLYVEQTPYCEAKNWFGLQGVIPVGNSGAACYQNFLRALG